MWNFWATELWTRKGTLTAFPFKVYIFREDHKNMTKYPTFFRQLSDLKQNLAISSNFIGLLRIYELYYWGNQPSYRFQGQKIVFYPMSNIQISPKRTCDRGAGLREKNLSTLFFTVWTTKIVFQESLEELISFIRSRHAQRMDHWIQLLNLTIFNIICWLTGSMGQKMQLFSKTLL